MSFLFLLCFLASGKSSLCSAILGMLEKSTGDVILKVFSFDFEEFIDAVVCFVG